MEEKDNDDLITPDELALELSSASRPYHAPILTGYGNLAQLIQSASGPGPDGSLNADCSDASPSPDCK